MTFYVTFMHPALNNVVKTFVGGLTRCLPSCRTPLRWSPLGSSSTAYRSPTSCLFLTDRWSAAACWPRSLPASRYPPSLWGCLHLKDDCTVSCSTFQRRHMVPSISPAGAKTSAHLWCPCGRSCCCAGRKPPPGSAWCSGASHFPWVLRTTSAGL